MGFDEERQFFVVSRALSAIDRGNVKEKARNELKCLVTKTLKSVFSSAGLRNYDDSLFLFSEKKK